VSERYGRPHSPRYEYTGIPDHRLSDRRETAISMKMALDRATDGNGAGKLLLDFYVNEIPWFVFSELDRAVLSRAIKRFRSELQRGGLLPDPKDGEEVDRGL
jgi:hypothetical protein